MTDTTSTTGPLRRSRRRGVVALMLVLVLAACGDPGPVAADVACDVDIVTEQAEELARDLGHEGDWSVVPPSSGEVGAVLVSPPLLTVAVCGLYATMQAAGPLALMVDGELRRKQHVIQRTSSRGTHSLLTFAFLGDTEVARVELVDESSDVGLGVWEVGNADPPLTDCADVESGDVCHGWTIREVVLEDPRVPRPLTGVAMLTLTTADRPGQPAYHAVATTPEPGLRIAVAPGPATRLMIDLVNGTDETVELDPPIEIPLDPTG